MTWKSHNNEKVPMFLWQNGWVVKQETEGLGMNTAGSLSPLGCVTRQGMLGLAWGINRKTGLL